MNEGAIYNVVVEGSEEDGGGEDSAMQPAAAGAAVGTSNVVVAQPKVKFEDAKPKDVPPAWGVSVPSHTTIKDLTLCSADNVWERFEVIVSADIRARKDPILPQALLDLKLPYTGKPLDSYPDVDLSVFPVLFSKTTIPLEDLALNPDAPGLSLQLQLAVIAHSWGANATKSIGRLLAWGCHVGLHLKVDYLRKACSNAVKSLFGGLFLSVHLMFADT